MLVAFLRPVLRLLRTNVLPRAPCNCVSLFLRVHGVHRCDLLRASARTREFRAIYVLYMYYNLKSNSNCLVQLFNVKIKVS